MSHRDSVSGLGTGIRPLVINPPRNQQAGGIWRILGSGSLLVLLLATGCSSKTLFKSNFDPNTIGQPPSPTQQVGTIKIDGLPRSVLVVKPPVQPSGKWVQISRINDPSQVAALQGNLSEALGDGRYVFSTILFMPAESGVATIQFERSGQPVTEPLGFLHLDFLEDNRVRIDDDDSTAFGTFPRGKPFIVQVTLNVNQASTARIVLGGDGATGEASRNIIGPLNQFARQFGAVRLWMGFPHTGAFSATNIVVTRRRS